MARDPNNVGADQIRGFPRFGGVLTPGLRSVNHTTWKTTWVEQRRGGQNPGVNARDQVGERRPGFASLSTASAIALFTHRPARANRQLERGAELIMATGAEISAGFLRLLRPRRPDSRRAVASSRDGDGRIEDEAWRVRRWQSALGQRHNHAATQSRGCSYRFRRGHPRVTDHNAGGATATSFALRRFPISSSADVMRTRRSVR